MPDVLQKSPAAALGGEMLGPRLRARRQALGLTLKEVAVEAGLSVGFISQIERGITGPSLSSLLAVSRVLGVDISFFLEQPQVDGPSTRHDQRLTYAVGNAARTYERLSATFPGNTLSSLVIHEPPRTSDIRMSREAHEGEEILYILDGALTVDVGGQQTVLQAHDSIHFPGMVPHTWWNHGDSPATLLWVGTFDVFGGRPAAGQTATGMTTAGRGALGRKRSKPTAS